MRPRPLLRPRPHLRPRPRLGWPRPLAHLALLLLLLSPAGGGAAHLARGRGNSWGGAESAQLESGEPHLAQVGQVTPEEPKAPAQVGEGQAPPPQAPPPQLQRRPRHSPHFPLCSFCCNCCNNRGCGFCCRT